MKSGVSPRADVSAALLSLVLAPVTLAQTVWSGPIFSPATVAA